MLRISHIKEVFVGFALVAILPTYYRLVESIGVGEIALLVISFGLISLSLVRKEVRFSGIAGRFALIFAAYIFMVLLPLTLAGLYFELPGVQIRDWAAYALSAVFVVACAVGRLDIRAAATYFIVFLCALILIQFVFGGSEVWYSSRFTAGAVNPNQLGLYVICGALLSLVCLHSVWSRSAALVVLVFGGILTRSDALVATVAALAAAYISISFVPKRIQLIVLPFVLGFLSLTLFLLGDELSAWLLDQWGSADPRGARSGLYMNGLKAWLDTPFTALVGHGAGSFSGVSGPYLGAEAHNTPIDMLTIGGLAALSVCYWVHLFVFMRAYRNEWAMVMISIVGLIVFSLFHYVARQPVWWFAAFTLAYLTDERVRHRMKR